MVFGVAGPSDRLLDFGVQLLGLFIIPVGAFTFDGRYWPDVGVPGALQRFSSFCGSAHLAAELFDLSVQLIYSFIRRSMGLGLLLSDIVDPVVIVASHGVFEAFVVRTGQGHPVAVLQGCTGVAGIVFSFDPGQESGIADTLFFGLEF